jgi:predicted transcriptional regulator
MANRRSKLELVFDILLAIRKKGGEIKPTHLMYKSNLSHKLLNDYLEELIGKEMIQITELELKRKRIQKTIVITNKGLDFLEEYNKIRQFTDAFGV